ncbi:hypothetical protein J4476_03545 [Candidatus Woesearchaeota archaeon]|nr:MAG: hypothetical protein QT09_C0006G0086 [archaeon GW2011_AR18]MBS3161742.1 hypothetical protein [Candidatus Woesearchaeota archaeon]HIH26302.1 hypothetical protein [Nanoarchaeota archaeon]
MKISTENYARWRFVLPLIMATTASTTYGVESYRRYEKASRTIEIATQALDDVIEVINNQRKILTELQSSANICVQGFNNCNEIVYSSKETIDIMNRSYDALNSRFTTCNNRNRNLVDLVKNYVVPVLNECMEENNRDNVAIEIPKVKKI